MSDNSRVNWKKVAQTLILCCGKCHVHSKCSNCCEVDIDPQLKPQVSTENIKTERNTSKEAVV
jgi:hypothetical protein